ncbi:MAG: hypothetical protein V4733_01845 [Verrucomicrobiota bacterium]
MTLLEYLSMRLAGILDVLLYCVPMIGFGAITGGVLGFLSAKRGLGFESAIIKSLLISAIPPLAFFFVVGLYEWRNTWPTPSEFTILTAIKSGLVHSLYFGSGMACVSSSAALVSTIVSLYLFKRRKYLHNKKKAEQ